MSLKSTPMNSSGLSGGALLAVIAEQEAERSPLPDTAGSTEKKAESALSVKSSSEQSSSDEGANDCSGNGL